MTSKRFTSTKEKIDNSKPHTLEEATKLVKECASAKFDESIELHLNLGIDPKQSDQQIRGTVVLPHGSGKTKRVAAFVDAANEKAAKDAGADIIGTEEVIDEIAKKGVIEFDVAIAVPSMMPKLAKAARVLGPRGLMPNPKTDTVGPNVAKMIEEQKGGKVAFRNDNTSNVHMTIAKASFDEAKILENLRTTLEALKKARPASIKGVFMKSVSISCTMGPSIRIDVGSI